MNFNLYVFSAMIVSHHVGKAEHPQNTLRVNCDNISKTDIQVRSGKKIGAEI